MQKIKQVLVIEDNPSDLILLKEYLLMGELNNPEILQLDRLGKVIKTPDSYQPDLIFLNLNLPDSNGLDTFHAVNNRFPYVPIIVLSGVQDSGMALEAIKSGAQDYILKGDFDEKSLLKTVRYSIERKKCQAEIRESQQNYASLVNTIDGIVWEADAISFQFSFVSRQAERLLGYPIEKWLNDPGFWKDHIYEEDRNWAVQYCIEQTEKKKSYEFEYRMVAADGRIIWLRDIVTVVVEAEKPVKLRGIMVDITALKKAEETLIINELRFRTLTSNAPVGIFQTDKEGKTIYVNETWMEFTGLSYNEAMGYGWISSLHPEDREQLTSKWKERSAGGLHSAEDFRFIDKKGNTRWVSGYAVPLYTKNGGFSGYIGTLSDITERFRAQQQIEKEKMLADSLIESLPGLFYLLDDRNRFIRWNNLMESITGYSNEEISKMNPFDLFDGNEKEAFKEYIKNGFINRETIVEAQLVTKAGKKMDFYFTAISLEYEGRQCLLGTGIDISARKEAEDQLRQSSKQLRELSAHLQNIREEERIAISREIHDELGQQLTVLKMDISWLKKKIGPKEEKLEQKINGLLEMIDNTVKTVRRISSDLRPSMLDDLGLVAALEWHSQEFEKRSGVKTEFITEVKELRLPETTATGMFRIFQESLTNVARHAGATAVTASLKLGDGKLLMQICDNGKGFSVNGIRHKKTLGILGMRERVFIMNGEYGIISSPGGGTTVEVTVPVENIN